MLSWPRFALARVRAAGGLFLTLLALVAATTGVIAGTVGYTAASATSSARAAVTGDEELTLRVTTRVAEDPGGQERLAREVIAATFAPAPVRVESRSGDGQVTFVITPDVDLLQPEDLPHYADGAGKLRLELRGTQVAVGGLTAEGDLAGAAAVAARNLMVSQALGAIPLSVLALVTVLAVVQVARLLGNSRAAQLSFLVARGASAGQVFALGAVESMLAVVVGSLLGTGAAVGALQTVDEGAAQWPVVVATGALCFVGTLVIVLGLLLAQVRAAVTPGYDVDRSGRTSRAVTGATLGLVLVAAAIALWQLTRAGSPLSIDDEGRYSVNLVAGAAPALLLAAAGVAALGLLGPLGVLATAITHRARGATAFLTAAQAARRITIYAAPVLLTVLAAGSATTAALYAGTSAGLRDDMAALADGAPLRATLSGSVPEIDVEGIDHATPVWLVDAATVGDTPVPATGVLLDEIRDVIQVPEGMRLLPDVGQTDVVGNSIAVPEGTEALTLQVDASLDLDPWGPAYFEALVEEVRHQMEVHEPDLDDDEIREATRRILTDSADRTADPATLDVQFLLRDLDSGDSRRVNAATTVPGPRLAFDETTLDGFTSTAGTVAAEHVIELDPSRRFAIDVVQLRLDSRVSHWPRTLTAQLRLDAGGPELLGSADASWASAHATTPDLAADLLAEREGLTPEVWWEEPEENFRITRHNHPQIRPILDTSGDGWRVVAEETSEEFWGSIISPSLRPAGPSPGDPAGADTSTAFPTRVALTPAAADAATLEVGDTFELQFMNRRIPAELVGIVDAVPGRTEPRAALVDMASAGAAFYTLGESPRPPSELWASTTDDPAEVAPALSEALGGTEVRVGGQESTTDPTSAARLTFWVACAGAILLAVTGIAAATSAMTTDRRAEVAVLRALGMTPRGQALSRVGELAGVVGASVAFGLAAGWLVSLLVVPALARATVAPDQVELSPPLSLDTAPWALLLSAGAVGVLLVLVSLARRVRAEALDDEYREEVR